MDSPSTRMVSKSGKVGPTTKLAVAVPTLPESEASPSGTILTHTIESKTPLRTSLESTAKNHHLMIHTESGVVPGDSKDLDMRYLFLLLAVTSCTDPLGTTKFLQNKGYTNIKILGVGGFDCWDEDDAVTKFTADKGGKTYAGSTCCSLFGCTWGKKPTPIKP